MSLMLLQNQAVGYAVMPRVAKGGDDVAVSPPPRHLRLERRVCLSRAGVRMARDVVPAAPL